MIRSIWWRAMSAAMSAGVPTMPGLTIRSPIRAGVVVDEADDPIGELALIEDLAHDLPRALPGADHEDPLLQLERAGQLVEQQPPAENPDDEDEQRRDEDAVADHQRRHREVERGEDDRRGADRLQQPDDQLAVRVDQRQVVEVVVVEAQLADDRDQADLPQVGGQIGARPAGWRRAPPIRRSAAARRRRP